MSKVIIFTGSPHKKGTTAALLAEIAEGAKSKGAEIIEYDLNSKDLRPCQSCYACKRPDAEACVQNDYLKPFYAELKDADAVVLGTPIYMGTITAQSWILINRLYPAMGADFKPRFPGKKFAIAVTHGNPNAEQYKAAAGSVLGFAKGLGWDSVGELFWPGANLENGIPDNIKAEAFAIGEKLAD